MLVLATFDQLTEDKKRQVYEFTSALPVILHFDGYEDMVRKYGGEVYAHGKQHFSLWHKGKVVGTTGVITREIPDRGEAFINAVYIEPKKPEAICRLLSRAFTHLMPYRVQTVTLGISTGCEYTLPYLKEVGFLQAYEFLQMTHRENIFPAAKKQIELHPLCEDNADSFRHIHNETFSTSPNGATLSEEQVQEMLNRSRWAGLCIHEGIPVGMYHMIREDSIGRIADIAVHPDFQGRGIGSLLVRRLVERVYEDGARKVQLEVASSNKAAVHLYKKCGFKQEKVLSRWFTLLPEEVCSCS